MIPCGCLFIHSTVIVLTQKRLKTTSVHVQYNISYVLFVVGIFRVNMYIQVHIIVEVFVCTVDQKE